MHKRITQIGGVAAAALALGTTASAEIKINDNFAFTGYAAGSYSSFDENPTDRFDLDAAKLQFNTTFNPVTAVASVYYMGGSTPGDDLTLLDAYVNYDAGNGVVITGGKFLSYLGYEAFDIPNMSTLSYANGGLLGGPIPGYHTGVKIGYTDKTFSAGVAVLDSVYGGLKGDGELKDNQGFEAYVSFTGIEGLTYFSGIAYQTDGGGFEKTFVWNNWVQYAVSKQLTVAAEVTTQDNDSIDGYNWLAYASFAVDDKVSIVGRVSGEDADDYGSFMKYTVAPTYKLTDNLLVRAEVSYIDFSDYPIDSDTFYGVQAVFKF